MIFEEDCNDTTVKISQSFGVRNTERILFCSKVFKTSYIPSFTDRPWMIVIEFMSNGSLDNFLKVP